MTFAGLFLRSHAIDNALPVSDESGKNDIAQPTGLRENKSITTARYVHLCPVQM
jgi:hypothetical protein